jgi:putative copper resistance protein D
LENTPLIIIRFATYADLMVLCGLSAFALYGLQGEGRQGIWGIAALLAGFGLLLSLTGIVALTAAMSGAGLGGVDRETLSIIVNETAIGGAWQVRMVALATAFGASLFLNIRPAAMLALVSFASAVAIATLVWTGHAGASEGMTGHVHRVSDIVHMLAAAIWIGGIAAFIRMLFKSGLSQSPERLVVAHRALDRFSRVGTVAVVLIAGTGLINGQILWIGVNRVDGFLTTPYGLLLSLKLVLFVGMLGLAAINRWRLTPALAAALSNGDPMEAVTSLRRSLALEAGAALSILALVAWLGMLEPLASMS